MMKKLKKLLRSEQCINYQRYQIQILIAEIEDLNADCDKVSRTYLL